MKKITLIGDVMCEPSFLASVKKNDGSYDFHYSLAPLKSLLDEADYRIANLETPLAGEEAQYSNTIFTFNAPDSFAEALRDSGIETLSLANNHCFDRGADGLRRTIQVLDEKGIGYTGAYENSNEKNRNYYFSAGETKIAVIAYTYGTNSLPSDKSDIGCVNYLRPAGSPVMREPYPESFVKLKSFMEKLLGRKLIADESISLRRLLGHKIAYSDNNYNAVDCLGCIDNLKKDYYIARENADVVLFYPHIGGQFNTEPGAFSSFIVAEALQIGFDAVIACHSHTTQKAEYVNEVPVYYSLGNVTMSSNSEYVEKDTLPQYGIAAHLYIEAKKISRTTFSIIKIVEEHNAEMLRVVPIDELYLTLTDENEKLSLIQEAAIVYARITGKKEESFTIQREYDL